MGVCVQALRWEQTSGSRGITCYWVKSVGFFFFFACKQVRLLFWNGACRCIWGVKCVWVTDSWKHWGFRNCIITLRLSVLLFFMQLRVFDTEMWTDWICDMFHDRPHILLFETSATSFWGAAVAPRSSELSLHGRWFYSIDNEHTASGVLD